MSAHNSHYSIFSKFLFILPLVAAVPGRSPYLLARDPSGTLSLPYSVENASPTSLEATETAAVTSADGASISSSVALGQVATVTDSARSFISMSAAATSTSVMSLASVTAPVSLTIANTADTIADGTSSVSTGQVIIATSIYTDVQSQTTFTQVPTMTTSYLTGSGLTTGTGAGPYDTIGLLGSVATDSLTTAPYPVTNATVTLCPDSPAYTGQPPYGSRFQTTCSDPMASLLGGTGVGASGASNSVSQTVAYTAASSTQSGTVVLPAAGRQACNGSTAMVCSSDGTAYGICDGSSALMLVVAAGTRCENGGISWA